MESIRKVLTQDLMALIQASLKDHRLEIARQVRLVCEIACGEDQVRSSNLTRLAGAAIYGATLDFQAKVTQHIENAATILQESFHIFEKSPDEPADLVPALALFNKSDVVPNPEYVVEGPNPEAED